MLNLGQAIVKQNMERKPNFWGDMPVKKRIHLNKLPKHKEEFLLFLVKTEDDYEDYMDFFAIKYAEDEQNDPLMPLLYREKKIQENYMSQDEFIKMFKCDQKEALEKLFQHPVSRSEVRYLLSMIKNKEMTLEFVYQKHMEIPTATLASILTKEVNFPRKQTTLENLDLYPGWRRILNYLIQTEEDLDDFIDNFWSEGKGQIISVSNFHVHKMQQNHMIEDEFIEMFYNNPIAALEKLFQRDDVYNSDITDIKRHMEKNPELLARLYQEHIKEPKRPLGSFIVKIKSGLWLRIA